MFDASIYVLGPYLYFCKFGAVLSIICGCEWFFDGGLLVEA